MIKTPLGKQLELETCDGLEFVAEPFAFTVCVVSKESSLDIQKNIDNSVSLIFVLSDGKVKRYVSGIYTQIKQGQTKLRGTEYTLEIRPRLWLLTLKSNCAVYQKKSVLEIVGEVLKKENIKYQDKTSGTFPKREYVVQYNETDFDFVSRLLEEAGVFYYFTHTETEATMVLGNKADIFEDAPGGAAVLPYVYENYSQTPKNEIRDITLTQRIVSRKVSVNDYYFEAPTTKLLASGGDKTLEMYEYPGGYTTKSDGEALAARRLQSLTATEKVLTATTSASGLAPGFRFKITGHPREDVNAAWVVTKMSVDASPHHYRAEIEAIPATVAPIPQRKTPKPRICGPIPALVVGKNGEEIETDKHVRIKVQFYFDRDGKNDENSSCWVRVAQSWAGSNYGTVFLPRIGQEVLVGFEGGDPDRPLVIGTVYNEKNKPPYELPVHATRSVIRSRSSKQGNAGNEISFEDKKDSEELYLHAQKDLRVDVENGRKTEIREADDSLTLKNGNRNIVLEKGNETRKIKGDFSSNVDGNYELVVKGNLTIKVDGSLTLESGKGTSLKSGTDAKIETKTALALKGGTDVKAEAGANLDLQGTAGFSLKGSAQGTVDGGGMLTVKGGVVKIN